MSTRIFRAIIVGPLMLAALAMPAAATASQYCYGKIVNVLLLADGRLLIVGTWRSDYTQMCNIHGTWSGISSEVCMSWYGAALKARADNTSTVTFFPESGSYTCANVPTYGNSLTPGYFMLYTD